MKRTIFLPVLLALAACSETPEEVFAKARAEFAAHDYNAARIHLAAFLDAKPGNHEAMLLQVKTLLALGDGDGSGARLRALAGNVPPTGELAELSAEAALLRKAYDPALALLGSTNSIEAERLRALIALGKDNPAAASIHFEKALGAGGNARVFADYGRFRLMSGDVAGAREMAARAVQAAPDGIDSLLLTGQLAVRQGDLKAALGQYSRAAKLYPASLAALIGKAATLGDLGRVREMQEVVDLALEVAPNDPSVLFLGARAAAAAKDWAKVRSLVQPVETTLPQIDPLRQIYGEALLRLGQHELAMAQLQPIARALPGNRDAIRLLAEAQLAAGDAAAAVVTLKPIADGPLARNDDLALMAKAAGTAHDPNAAEYEKRSKQPAPQSLGRDVADADAAMRAGNWAGAAEAYERILKATDGRNIIVLNNMAYAQLMLGNHDKALEFASRALKIAPDNASVLDTAGWARFRSGKDVAEAKRLLRRAAQQAPQNMTIRAHLAEAERAPG